jgi:RNA polymerase-binding transcription factor DksA
MRRAQIAQHISDSGLDAYKDKLTAVLDRLTLGHRNDEVDAATRASGLPVSESGIELALFCRRNLAANRSDWTGFLARQVSEALERIDNGNYGLRLNCGQPIPPKRLAALPWVAFCIACQEETETLEI